MDIGRRLELIYTIRAQDLAKELSKDPEDNFPEVFARSRMIAVMELTAARLMKSELAHHELSAGVNVNVTHMAATPNNEEVKVVATFQVRGHYWMCAELAPSSSVSEIEAAAISFCRGMSKLVVQFFSYCVSVDFRQYSV